MEKITTKQAISLLRLINKMGIKDTLISFFKESARFEKEKQNIMVELFDTLEDKAVNITEELTTQLFIENPTIYIKYKDVEEKEQMSGLTILTDIILAVPNAEKDFYKCVSEIFNITVKEAEEKDIVETIKGIMDIFKSQQFMGFFQSAMK